jgi:hypothetical protein
VVVSRKDVGKLTIIVLFNLLRDCSPERAVIHQRGATPFAKAMLQENAGKCRKMQENTGRMQEVCRKYAGNFMKIHEGGRETQKMQEESNQSEIQNSKSEIEKCQGSVSMRPEPYFTSRAVKASYKASLRRLLASITPFSSMRKFIGIP